MLKRISSHQDVVTGIDPADSDSKESMPLPPSLAVNDNTEAKNEVAEYKQFMLKKEQNVTLRYAPCAGRPLGVVLNIWV